MTQTQRNHVTLMWSHDADFYHLCPWVTEGPMYKPKVEIISHGPPTASSELMSATVCILVGVLVGILVIRW